MPKVRFIWLLIIRIYLELGIWLLELKLLC